jgi:hypothetical protein
LLRKLLFVLLLSNVSVVTAGAATRYHVPPSVFAKVLRVHNCEEPSWSVRGSKYAGGLGWLLATWTKYKLPGMPLSAADATPEQQARAMLHFVHVANHDVWPDQISCHGY